MPQRKSQTAAGMLLCLPDLTLCQFCSIGARPRTWTKQIRSMVKTSPQLPLASQAKLNLTIRAQRAQGTSFRKPVDAAG